MPPTFAAQVPGAGAAGAAVDGHDEASTGPCLPRGVAGGSDRVDGGVGGGISGSQLCLPDTPPLGAGASAVVHPATWYGARAAAKVVQAGPPGTLGPLPRRGPKVSTASSGRCGMAGCWRSGTMRTSWPMVGAFW